MNPSPTTYQASDGALWRIAVQRFTDHFFLSFAVKEVPDGDLFAAKLDVAIPAVEGKTARLVSLLQALEIDGRALPWEVENSAERSEIVNLVTHATAARLAAFAGHVDHVATELSNDPHQVNFEDRICAIVNAPAQPIDFIAVLGDRTHAQGEASADTKSPSSFFEDIGSRNTAYTGTSVSDGSRYEMSRPERGRGQRAGNRNPSGAGTLYDVVLVDPGFSEFRTGKVLAVVLSISYVDALELMGRTPCRIGWSIPQSQALQLKELIEGTGARVKLVDPV